MAAPGDRRLLALSNRVARRLRSAGLTIATAESCTGGLLAKCLTDISGSSEYFERGWVTYTNAAKRAELRVGAKLLAKHGAVSRPVVRAMAAGALRVSGAKRSIAVTGIAGPTGGTKDKPVGTVWIAWGIRRRGGLSVTARRYRFPGNRDAVRRRTVAVALQGLLKS